MSGWRTVLRRLGLDRAAVQGRGVPAGARHGSSIVLCPDGPILVRGDVSLVLPDGRPVPRSRDTVALCRCGASAIKPYCDGTHKVNGFTTGDPGRAGCAPAADAAPLVAGKAPR